MDGQGVLRGVSLVPWSGQHVALFSKIILLLLLWGRGGEDTEWCGVLFGLWCYIGLAGAALCRLPGLLQTPYFLMLLCLLFTVIQITFFLYIVTSLSFSHSDTLHACLMFGCWKVIASYVGFSILLKYLCFID